MMSFKLLCARVFDQRQNVGRAFLVVADAFHTWDGGHRTFLCMLSLVGAWNAGDWARTAFIAIEVVMGVVLTVQLALSSARHARHVGRWTQRRK